MTADRIKAVVLAVLEGWPLYEQVDQVTVAPIHLAKRWLYIGYYTRNPYYCLFKLNAQFDTGILYLLEIELPAFLRGKGHGAKLYDAVVEIARRLELREVRQTPSGWVHTGESREDWLLRRGWTADSSGREVFKVVSADS
jgi:hypothetical protein